MSVIDASMGFKSARLWRVRRAGVERLVLALDNYTAAEACGFHFAQCEVTECPRS